MSKRDLLLEAADIEGDEDIDEVEEFSFEGYQVVRREFYAHTFDAAINFKYDSITFNTACINKLEGDYIHLLVNPTEKKLVIRECDIDAKDAVRWCRFNKKQQKRVPRKILCRLFAAKIFDLMGWYPEYKYKLQGNVVRTNEEMLVVFNMTETEIYTPVEKSDDGSTKKSSPYYPEDWKNSFGLPVDSHRTSLIVNIIEGYQRLEVQQGRRKKKKEETPSNQQSLFDYLGDGSGKK